MISTPGSGRRAVSSAAAVLGTGLIWTLAVPIADTDLTIGSGPNTTTVGLGSVLTVTLIVALAATGLAVLLSRITARPRRAWLIVAVATLLVSLAGPLGSETTGAAAVGVLLALHLVVGATLILGIGGTLPITRQRTDPTRERQPAR